MGQELVGEAGVEVPERQAMTTPYTVWCINRGVTHAHCPMGCEHPQPFVAWTDTSKLLCGRCYFKFGMLTEMEPCVPEFCKDRI
jgi:hypothetical protein